MAKDPKFKANGEPDGRGHGDGSVPTRFAPGDGRRRPGRPKGSKDERTLVLAIRDMTIVAHMEGRTRRLSTREAYFFKMREKAIKGEQKAVEWLDRKIAQYDPPAVEPDRTAELLADDAEILLGAQGRGVTPLPTGPAQAAAGEEEQEED